MKRRAAIFAVLALIAGTVFASTSASAAMDGTMIRSQHSNLCLTVSDYNTGNGAGVLMVECQNAPHQLWWWDGLNLRSVHTNKCLTAAWDNVGDGAALHMWDCHGWYSQMFYRPGGEHLGRIQQIRSPNPCVEIAGGNMGQGASVQLWRCHNGRNHFWTV